MRVEMIRLKASGQVATLYDMYYRTYCEKFGWLGWAGNSEKSGSAGYDAVSRYLDELLSKE